MGTLCAITCTFLRELGSEHSVWVTSCDLGEEKGEGCVPCHKYGTTQLARRNDRRDWLLTSSKDTAREEDC